MLLILDISPNGFFRNMTNRLNIVGASPKAWQSLSQAFKFLTQSSGSVAFELLNNIMGTIDRRCFNEQMNMIGHNFQVLNRYIDFGGFLKKKLSKPCLDQANQNFPPILGAPYNMIPKIKDCLITSCPACIIHPNIIHAADI